MRAVVIHSSGGPEVLEVVEAPIPRPGDGQVRIRVEAAAVNPVDLAIRAGLLAQAGLMAARDTAGIGWDVAGAVVVVWDDRHPLRPPAAGALVPGDEHRCQRR